MKFDRLDHLEYFTIRAYEVDHRKQASTTVLLKLMQEAAMQHVLQLGLSVWDLEPHRLAWVLMRQHLEVARMPLLGEAITVLTRPTGFERQFTYRDFVVLDAEGEIIAAASSTWLLMNTDSREMAPIPDVVLAFKEEVAARAAEAMPRPPSRLPAMSGVDSTRLFTVYWHDLDFNAHLNNVVYTQWMLETLPDEVLREGTIKEFTIQFRAEAHWKDEVRSEAQRKGEGVWLHRLVRVADEKVLALAKVELGMP